MADIQTHYRSLENMYQAAPINEFYHPVMQVSDSEAVIEIELREQLHHSGGGVHGSVYFKMLDDAAFFAANSLVEDFFVLTASFTTELYKPVATGKMKAIAKVSHIEGKKIYAEATVYNSDDEEIGHGHGLFLRGRTPLSEAKGYGVK